MKENVAFVVLFFGLIIATGRLTVGCSAAQSRVVAQDALTTTQILCVLATSLSDDASIAEACDIDKTLIPLVRPYLAAKENVAVRSRRVRQCADAGADGQ